MIEPGDVRWYRFPEPDKRRPVVVLGRADVVSQLSDLVVIPFSSRARGLEWEVAFGTDDGLPGPCVLKPEWIRCVPRDKLGPRICTLPGHRWGELRNALLNVTGLAFPPGDPVPLADAVEQFRRAYVLGVLERCGGNRSHAARALGVDPRTVFRFLERNEP